MAKLEQRYRIAVLGDAGVGKTTLLMRLQTGRFINTESSTFTLCGRDVIQYEILVDNTIVTAVFRDTAGGERFRTLTRSYFRENDAVILVYDVQSNFTLADLHWWIEEAQGNVDGSRCVWAIFGNKCDLDSNFEQGVLDEYRLKLDTNLSFFTSAKTGLNVKTGFEAVIANLHRTAIVNNWKRPIGSTSVDLNVQNKSESQCC